MRQVTVYFRDRDVFKGVFRAAFRDGSDDDGTLGVLFDDVQYSDNDSLVQLTRDGRKFIVPMMNILMVEVRSEPSSS